MLPGHQQHREQQHLRQTSLRNKLGHVYSPVSYPVPIYTCSNTLIVKPTKAGRLSEKQIYTVVHAKQILEIQAGKATH